MGEWLFGPSAVGGSTLNWVIIAVHHSLLYLGMGCPVIRR